MSPPVSSFLQNNYLAFNSGGIGTTGTRAVTMWSGPSPTPGNAGDGSLYLTSTDNLSPVFVHNVQTPVLAYDACNKYYADQIAAGITWKDSVVLATTVANGNITLSGTQTIDSVATTNGERVLIKNQTSAVNNGIYITASGAWSRSTDMAVGADAAGDAMYVESGLVNSSTSWVCTSPEGSAIVGTNNLTFSLFSSTSPAAGSSYEVQYNYNGLFAASPNFNYIPGTGLSILDSGTSPALQVTGASTFGLIAHFNDSVDSTSTGSGSVVVMGGVGVGLSLTVGNTTTTNFLTASNAQVTSGATGTGSTSGAFTVNGDTGILGTLYLDTPGSEGGPGGLIIGNTALDIETNTGPINLQTGNGSAVNIVGTLNSTGPTTGSFVVYGGAGIEKNLYVGGQLFAAGGIVITSTADTTNPSTGAFVLDGGMGIEKSLQVANTTTTNVLVASLANINNAAIVSENVTTSTIGSLFATTAYVTGATITSENVTTSTIGSLFATGANITTGLITTSTIGSLFATTGLITTSTIGSMFVTGSSNLSGPVSVLNSTNSTGPSTGALVVTGGAGIEKNLYVGGQLFAAGGIVITSTADTTSPSTGAFVLDGGMGIEKSLQVAFTTTTQLLSAGTAYITSGSLATGATAGGALIVNGDTGLYGTLYLDSPMVDGGPGGIIIGHTKLNLESDSGPINLMTNDGSPVNITGSTSTTGPTTGSLVVTGGVGILGDMFVGNGTNSISNATGSIVVNGGIGASGDVTANQFNATSDIQYKTDIEHLDQSLDKLRQIEGYSYNWKPDFIGRTNKRQIGVLAQQLESVNLGNLVSGTQSKSVNYLGLIPLLIEGVKELALKVDILEEFMKDLKE